MSQQPIPYLFQAISRQTNPEAPIYDPVFDGVFLNGVAIKGAIKTFVDPNPASDPVTYRVANPDATWGQLTMSARVAGLPNLPGHPDYPVYVYQPSKATFNGGPLPFGVVSQADATELSKELGNAPITDLMAGFGTPPAFPLIYPSDDPRRAFSVGGFEAAKLLAAKYANGVGAPGHWDTSQNPPAWIADFPVPAQDAVVLPLPVGPIPAGAKLLQASITSGVMTLDVPDAPSSSSSSTSDSLFTPARAAIMDRMDGFMKKFGS